MITITIAKNKLEAKGHSGYAPCGQDIVCAGVSTLFNAFILSAGKDVTAVEKSGYTLIEIAGDDPYTRAKYEMLVTGLRDISEEFPEHVTIIDQAFTS